MTREEFVEKLKQPHRYYKETYFEYQKWLKVIGK
jgi:hypothetical protein